MQSLPMVGLRAKQAEPEHLTTFFSHLPSSEDT